MPRKARSIRDGVCYHVFNHTLERRAVFDEPTDYWEFIELMRAAQARTPLDLFAACLMPDRFHLLLRPRAARDLGAWMQWVLSTQVRRWHMRDAAKGRLWRGRFKTFRIAPDEHLLEAMRFVEAAPARAQLIDQAQYWSWSSLNWRLQAPAPVELTAPPLALPQDWIERVNIPQSAESLARLSACLDKQTPYE